MHVDVSLLKLPSAGMYVAPELSDTEGRRWRRKRHKGAFRWAEP